MVTHSLGGAEARMVFFEASEKKFEVHVGPGQESLRARGAPSGNRLWRRLGPIFSVKFPTGISPLIC